MNKLLKVFIYLTATVLLLFFFSYKLTSIPDGITGDEAAFGYNAVLLSRTLHDENGRFLPIFVLSLNGTDWRQPITQYFITSYFKVFGPSLFNLRFTSVIVAVLSIFLIYLLGRELFKSQVGGILSAIFLITTPLFIIHSHMGLDNIYPIPFVIIWLLGLYKFSNSKKIYWLIVSAIALGIGFYSYKAMRIFVPIWTILSLTYIFEKRNLKPLLYFIMPLLPFFLIIPKLEFLYAGAVLNNEKLIFPGVYNFFYSYLSNFDLGFLFIRGDDLLFHSTGIHGMYLLTTLPFFVFGIIKSWNKDKFWRFLVISFFTGPVLFGFLGQIHRASRLMAEIPVYAIISAYGAIKLWEFKSKLPIFILEALFLLNYFDFLNFYLKSYADKTKNLFNCFYCSENAYKILANESGKGLTPYVDNVIVAREGETQNFSKAIYYDNPINTWSGDIKSLPDNFILMTENSRVMGLKNIANTGNYWFYVKIH